MSRLLFFLFFFPITGISQSTTFPEKRDLTKIYTQAISDFIIDANKKHHTRFDTLYFGKHLLKQLRFEYFRYNTTGATHGSAQPSPVSFKAGPAIDSEVLFNKYPSARLLSSIILLGCGLLLMWTLNKKYNNNDKFPGDYYEKTWHNENLSMDEHHTVFHGYYRKEPVGCFLIAGLVVVGGIAVVIGSIGWYLYVLIFSN